MRPRDRQPPPHSRAGAPVPRAERSLAPRLARRLLLAACAVGTALLLCEPVALAESPSAPVEVQAQITARILPFERGFTSRAQAGVNVLIAEKPGNADSLAASLQMKKALQDIGSVSGKRFNVQSAAFTNAKDFVVTCKSRGAVVVYLTPGLGPEVSQVAAGLNGSPILTVAAVEDFVPSGAVLGVKVVSGKPRMSINLGQAKAQNLNFPSAVLKLAKIY